MNTDVAKFTYKVTWSEKDGEYVGLCAEFPSLSWLDEDQDEAFKGIRKLIADTVKDMEKANEPVPVPLAKRDFSGVFKVRVPASIHRALVLEAAEAGVSLNRVVSAKLSR